MRILHVLDHSIPLHSGYSFRTLAILRGQRAMGWETLHVTGAKQGSPADGADDVDGLRFHRTRARVDGLYRWPLVQEVTQMRDLERRVEAVARAEKPDILHAHSPVLNAFPALGVGRRLGIPVVYEVRAFWEDAAADHGTAPAWGPRYRLTRGLETTALRRAQAATTICEGLRGDIVARGIAPETVTVIPNAVDIEKFPGAEAPDPALTRSLGLGPGPILGFIGSFYPYEGLDVLVDALPAIRAQIPSAQVLLVGGGPDDERLRARAAAAGAGDAIRFVGRVPHTDVPRYYDLVDVLVYPRRHSRLTDLVTPLKPLEAMAQGRLVVASDVGGHRELIQDGVTGALFRAEDPAALAATVVQLLRAPERFPEIRRAARHMVETERTWPTVVARYRQVYASAMARRG